MKPGVILIHGYTGGPADFGMLPTMLAERCGSAAVHSFLLPHHDHADPPFDGATFVAAIGAAAAAIGREGRELIVIAHSTGGTLALAAIAAQALAPRLLVLAAVPNRIDGSYLERWNRHSTGKSTVSFASMARMVSHINKTASQSVAGIFPVLFLQGEDDQLVPCREVSAWQERFAGPVRTVIVPQAGHHLFHGQAGGFALDVVTRAVADAGDALTAQEEEVLSRLVADEPEVGRFLAVSPGSARHLAACPGARLPQAPHASLPEMAAGEPIFANIEITTRCNLRCAFCARTGSIRGGGDMPLERFGRILDLLPHAYRVTLVGLGEPLLHPDIAALVAAASRRGRRVTIATNAQELTAEMSYRLLDAGLDAMVFSLDAAIPEVAEKVRPGTDLGRVLDNIRGFAAIAAAQRPIPRAVFSTVSTDTAPYLEQLVTTVAELGVDVLMLSDLNFRDNLAHTLWKNRNAATTAAVHQAIRTAFALHLPVLSVRGLEEFAPALRYQAHLLVPPGQLYHRSVRHRHCFSPWQTIPVAVDGTMTVCDCQPDQVVGNLLDRPFSELWQGRRMAGYRRQMQEESPPEPCGICPRF